MRLSPELQRPERVPGEAGWAAVAVLLFKDLNSTLLIKRASIPTDPWSGEVAFPGGRFEQSDGDLIETAIRECREETGIALSRDSYVGVLSVNSPSNAPHIKVLPAVFLVDSRALEGLRVNRAEVEEAFLLDVGLNGAKPTRISMYGRSFEAIEYKGYIIWGMTYRILEELLEKLRGDPNGG